MDNTVPGHRLIKAIARCAADISTVLRGFYFEMATLVRRTSQNSNWKHGFQQDQHSAMMQIEGRLGSRYFACFYACF